MRKGWKIFFAVLLCIVLLAGVAVYLNWNTVLGVIDGLRYSQEEVEKKQEENKQELQKFLDDNKDVTVRELSEEESKALENGEISEEDAIKIITGSMTLDEVRTQNSEQSVQGDAQNGKTETDIPADTPSNPAEQKPQNNPPLEEEKSSDKIISELIAHLYVQKSVYLSKLDGLEASLAEEWAKIPKDKKKTEKPKIVAKYMPVIADWEKTCDSVVYGILDQIETEVKKSGKDLSIVEKIEQAYKNEKKLKKAYYINNYMS